MSSAAQDQSAPSTSDEWEALVLQARHERDKLRTTLKKIAEHATAASGIPDKDKLVGIAQEARRALG